VLGGWETYVLLSLFISSELTASRDVPKLDPNARRPSNVTQPQNARSREQRFEEMYVLEEADWLRSQPNVARAVQERGMQIHAFVYDKEKHTCVRLIEESNEKL
jgi:carbonic anhydrase